MRLKAPASILLSTTLVTPLTACGTVFYPERRGQISGVTGPLKLNAILQQNLGVDLPLEQALQLQHPPGEHLALLRISPRRS